MFFEKKKWLKSCGEETANGSQDERFPTDRIPYFLF